MLLQFGIFVLCSLFDQTFGHGMLWTPPGRSSLWRKDPRGVVNYDDNSNYCGGASVQWSTYGGRCGLCGDSYGQAHPQDNENTGKYGQGVLAAEYAAGSVIDVEVKLTTNHLGHFNFSLCVLENPAAPEPGEGCFQGLTLANGDQQYVVPSGENLIAAQVQLPPGLRCDRCVLRWHYQAGNNWGQCDDGTYGKGCGPQETFRSCSDIAIS